MPKGYKSILQSWETYKLSVPTILIALVAVILKRNGVKTGYATAIGIILLVVVSISSVLLEGIIKSNRLSAGRNS